MALNCQPFVLSIGVSPKKKTLHYRLCQRNIFINVSNFWKKSNLLQICSTIIKYVFGTILKNGSATAKPCSCWQKCKCYISGALQNGLAMANLLKCCEKCKCYMWGAMYWTPTSCMTQNGRKKGEKTLSSYIVLIVGIGGIFLIVNVMQVFFLK
jgi:hypothetical protein